MTTDREIEAAIKAFENVHFTETLSGNKLRNLRIEAALEAAEQARRLPISGCEDDLDVLIVYDHGTTEKAIKTDGRWFQSCDNSLELTSRGLTHF